MKTLYLRTLTVLLAGCASLNLLAETVFIKNATVYSMGTPAVLQGADILVKDGRIAQIGSKLKAPGDATVIEGSNRPVTPAFFAGITALGLEEISLEQTTVDQALHYDRMHPEFDVTVAYNPFSASIPVTRIEGYGWTMLDAGRNGSIIGGQGRAVSLDGGYDSFLSPSVLFVGLGSQNSALSGNSRAGQFMLLNQAMDESRSAVAWSPDVLLTAEGRRVLAGFSGNNTVVFDVNRASDILQVLAFAQRNSINPVILGGAEAWIVAEQLAEAGVPVVLDPLINLPNTFDMLGARLDNAAILHAAGVTIAFTAMSDAPHSARKLRQAAGIAVAYGLPHEAGIAALTTNPAAIFGLDPAWGALTVDTPANLVIWSGDPLEVTTLAQAVFLDGKSIPLVSRQTLLRDRYLPRDPGKPRAYIKP